MKNQDIAHAFAYANAEDRETANGASLYYENDTIYSYGRHFPVARKIRDRHGNTQFVLFNDSGYSKTTSSHQSMVKAALFQETITVSDPEASPKGLAKDLTDRMIDAAFFLSNAKGERRKKEYLKEIKIISSHLLIIVDFYRIKSKLPKLIRDIYNMHGDDELIPFVTERAIKEKKKLRAFIKKKQILIEKQREQEYQEELENIQRWKSFEIDSISLRLVGKSFLRVTAEGVNTSQGISIPMAEAIRLIQLIEVKQIIGAKVNDLYTVSAFNGLLQVGCHSIERAEVLTAIDEIKKITRSAPSIERG